MLTKLDIETYFEQIKQLDAIVLLACAVFFSIAIFLYCYKKTDIKLGFAIAFACLSIAIYSFVLPFKNKQTRLCKIELYNYDLHPEYLKSKTIPIIQKQLSNINYINWVCYILIAAMLVLAYTKFKKIALLRSLFLGIAIMLSLVVLRNSYFQLKTNGYKNLLTEFTKQFTVA
jgi:hypothetical protein